MPDVEILSVKIAQPIACKCGHEIKRGDVQGFQDRVQIICFACHASVMEILCDIPEGDEPWD